MYGLLCEAPDADRVCTPSELSTHMPNLGESDVLGHDVANLIHGGTPAEPAVEVVEYLDGVRGVCVCLRLSVCVYVCVSWLSLCAFVCLCLCICVCLKKSKNEKVS